MARMIISDLNIRTFGYCDKYLRARSPEQFKGMPFLAVLELGLPGYWAKTLYGYIYDDHPVGNDIRAITPGAFGGLENVAYIELSYNNISVVETGVFGGLHGLENLGLRDNRLRVLAASALKDARRLRIVLLDGNAISAVEPGAFHPVAPLDYVWLAGNEVNCSNFLMAVAPAAPECIDAETCDDGRLENLGHGYCDEVTDVSECAWDAGDCK